MITLSEQKLEFLKATNYILATGGPGCGKTFISLKKAKKLINDKVLKIDQYILFLSFARSTIARVEQQAKKNVSFQVFDNIEINTYHSFIWNILKSHGYLLTNKFPIRILTPPESSSLLSEFNEKVRLEKKMRLFYEDGVLDFELFAEMATELLNRSKSLQRIICDSYPYIIVDEFQDTNDNEWNFIKILGQKSKIIALADPDQRIYEFRGAKPYRIQEFVDYFKPDRYDFSDENHRSNGTDILSYGNDLLAGINKQKSYKDVSIKLYQIKSGVSKHIDLKQTLLQRIKILNNETTNWSLAILVPTKRLMLEVSDYLLDKQFFLHNGLPSIQHDVALDCEGPALAAVVIANILEGNQFNFDTYSINELLLNLIAHIRGRIGSKKLSKSDLDLTNALNLSLKNGKIIGARRRLLIDECWRIVERRKDMVLSGDPFEDWLSVRRLFEDSVCSEIHQIYQDAKFLRFLRKGTQLRSNLSEIWKINGNYYGAVSYIKNALLQEHFSTAIKDWNGVNLMTIHKSKGKEFNEVIIYEGSYSDRILREGSSKNDYFQARNTLRVAVTRAISHTTIFTPINSPCQFLI